MPTAKDLSHIPQQHYRLIHDLYVMLQDGDNKILREFGLNVSQFAVLLLLDAHRGQRLITLSQRLLLARSTITRIIDHLENEGLVHRILDPDDRRAQQVTLTPAGVRCREEAEETHRASLRARLDVLSEEEHEQLAVLLNKLRIALNTDPDGHGSN